MFGSTNMLILKITRDCNLRCKYCYVHGKDNYKGEKIEFELFKKIIEKIIIDRSTNRISQKEKFSLIFHGGEPLLYTPNELTKMMNYAEKRFIDSDINFSFGMQTNLTLLTDDLALVLNRYSVSLGISFDGIDNGNISRTSAYDVDNFEDKFKILDNYSIGYGFLMVVSESNIHTIKESVDFLKKEYNIKAIKINYAEDVNNIGGEVSGKEFFEKGWKPFLEEFIETGELIESNLQFTFKTFITNSLAHTDNNHKSNCGLKICGGGSRIIEMNPDGEVYLCGRYSKDFEEAYIQNVLDYDFLELHQINTYLNFVSKKSKIISKVGCDLCLADNICDHGCMAFHYSKFNKYGIREDLVCEIFKNLYKYYVKNQFELIKAYFNKNKNNNNESFIQVSRVRRLKTDSQLFNKLQEFGIVISIDKNGNIMLKAEK